MYEASYAGGEDAALTAAMLQRLAEKDAAFYGAPISPSMVASKSTTAGMVKDIKFLDTETCFWQLALQQLQQFKASTGQGIPSLSEPCLVHGCWLRSCCDGIGFLVAQHCAAGGRGHSPLVGEQMLWPVSYPATATAAVQGRGIPGWKIVSACYTLPDLQKNPPSIDLARCCKSAQAGASGCMQASASEMQPDASLCHVQVSS